MRDLMLTVARATRRRPWMALAGPIAVPVLVAGLLAWAFGDGLVNQGAAVAAVVNNDSPVTIDGQLVPLGRQLAGKLVDGPDRRYQWVLTNDADARQGLAAGDYAAVVTVPATFSERATSAATATDPLTAQQGLITVTTARDAALADHLLSQDVTDATVAALNQQVVQTYLDKIYLGFTTMHDKLGEATDGANRLADGTGRLSTGSRQLADGGSTLAVGLGELAGGAGQASAGAASLAGGARELRSGTAALADGAGELAGGTRRLAKGASTLSDGLNKAQAQTASLPAQTRRLADGARQVADGNRRLADTVVPYADTAIRVIDTLPPLSGPARQLRDLAADCDEVTAAEAAAVADTVSKGTGGGAARGLGTSTRQADAFCARLQKAAGKVAAEATRLDRSKAKIRGQVVQLRGGVVALKDGSEQVARGNEELARRVPTLTRGIAQAAAGARQLRSGAIAANTGARQVAAGSREVAAGAAALSSGADALADGVDRLAAGSGQAQRGARTLADGAGQLVSGAVEAERGAGQLADGLASARGEVPSYTAAQRRHLAQVAATPAAARSDVAHRSRLTGSFFLVLALWVGALATFLARRPVAADALTSRTSTWRLVTRTAVPGAGIAVVSGVLLGAGMSVYLHLGVGRGLGVVALAVAVAVSFTLLHQAVTAAFGWPGGAVSLAALVVTAAVGVVSTVPSGMKSVEALLPTHDAMVALRAVAVGGGGLPGAVSGLVLWLLIGVLGTVYVTERRRTASARLLRRTPSLT
jgi:putative membrane protein